MSVNITFNGQVYTIPQPHDTNWGANLTSFFVAIPAGALQKTGGNFDLSADINFGASFGLIAKYLKSNSSNIASTGNIRFANTDTIDFRNFANSGNLPLGVNNSDQLTFNGTPIIGGTGITQLTGDVTAGPGTGSQAATVVPTAAVKTLQADANPLLTGAVQLLSGSNITLNQVGQAITINGSASGANTALGNLISTAINQNLLPDVNGARSLGTTSFRWGGNFFDATTLDGSLSLEGATPINFNADSNINIAYSAGDQNLHIQNLHSNRGVLLESSNLAGTGGFVQLAVQPGGGGPHAILNLVDPDGASPQMNVVFNSVGFGLIFQVDNNTGAGETPLRVYDISAGTIKRVSIGAADSGGVGFKVLRIPN